MNLLTSRRTYTEIAYLSTSRIMTGFADVRLRDGTSGRLIRRPDGTWLPVLRGIEVDLPQRSWEEAFSRLQHALAAEGVMLRAAG